MGRSWFRGGARAGGTTSTRSGGSTDRRCGLTINLSLDGGVESPGHASHSKVKWKFVQQKAY